jgi:hypothetical protein
MTALQIRDPKTRWHRTRSGRQKTQPGRGSRAEGHLLPSRARIVPREEPLDAVPVSQAAVTNQPRLCTCPGPLPLRGLGPSPGSPDMCRPSFAPQDGERIWREAGFRGMDDDIVQLFVRE